MAEYLFESGDELCHCGRKNMHWHNSGLEYNSSLRYYCSDCAENRCDTSDGMIAGCPNVNR